MLDVLNGTGCFRVHFVLGEPDLKISEVVSYPVYFINNFSYTIGSTYNTLVGAKIAFVSPIYITVKTKQITNIVSNEIQRCN